MVVGASMMIGPMIGGELIARVGSAAPFAFAAALSLVSFVYMALFLPEYLPAHRRANDGPGNGARGSRAPWRELVALLGRSPGLSWYLAATAFANAGLGAYSSTQAFWAREALAWGARDLGRFISVTGIFVAIVQGGLLPMLQARFVGREGRLAQLCLVLNAAKVCAYGSATDG